VAPRGADRDVDVGEMCCRALLPLNRLASRRPPPLATQGFTGNGQPEAVDFRHRVIAITT
jgi:hypothetical protein